MSLLRTFDSSTTFLLKKLTDVHLRKSQMHSYQAHSNFVTAKRTSLLAFYGLVKFVLSVSDLLSVE